MTISNRIGGFLSHGGTPKMLEGLFHRKPWMIWGYPHSYPVDPYGSMASKKVQSYFRSEGMAGSIGIPILIGFSIIKQYIHKMLHDVTLNHHYIINHNSYIFLQCGPPQLQVGLGSPQ